MKDKRQPLGKRGEMIALRFLKKKGYKILACNWRYGREEIDIIAQIPDRTIFVEVKTRQTNRYGYPEQAVTPKKQAAIARVATAYLYKHEITTEIRFDIIAITLQNNRKEIYHIEDAFF